MRPPHSLGKWDIAAAVTCSAQSARVRVHARLSFTWCGVGKRKLVALFVITRSFRLMGHVELIIIGTITS